MRLVFALALFALAFAAADDKPLPRNVCGAMGGDGKPFQTIEYGAIMCAATQASDVLPKGKQGGVTLTAGGCTPAFCNSNTVVHVCQTGPHNPGTVDMKSIMNDLQDLFISCNGVIRVNDNDNSSHILAYDGSAYHVRSQAIQRLTNDYSITVRGQDCNSDGSYRDVTVDNCIGPNRGKSNAEVAQEYGGSYH